MPVVMPIRVCTVVTLCLCVPLLVSCGFLTENVKDTMSEDVGPFEVLGIVNSGGESESIWLNNLPTGRLKWRPAPGASSYQIVILDSTQVEICNQTLMAPADDFSMNSCALANGEYTLQLLAVNGDAKIEADNSPYTFKVDLNAPTVSYTNTQSSPTNSTTMTVSGTCSDIGSGFGAGAIQICIRSVGACTNSDYTISADCNEGTYSKDITLVNGLYDIKVRAIDIAGGVSTVHGTVGQDFVLDTVAPSASSFLSNPSLETSSTSASFTFTAVSDSGGSGLDTQECFLDGSSVGVCTTSYDALGLADGDHTFRIVGTDLAGNASEVSYTWNVNTLAVAGDDFFLGQQNTLWANTFSATGGSGNFTYSLPVNPAGATVDASGQVSLTSAATERLSFTVRVTDNITARTAEHSFVVEVYAADVCVWDGDTSTDWDTASNWSFCAGAAPLTTSKIAIASEGDYMPVVSANKTVNSFGLGPGGGIITVDPSRTLTMSNNSETIRSSVRVRGSSAICTDCQLRSQSYMYITDDARLTLETGISVRAGSTSDVYLGNGSSAGHLVTGTAGAKNEWPRIIVRSLRLEGAVSAPSSISIDGLKFEQASDFRAMRLMDWWSIEKFDNVLFIPNEHAYQNENDDGINFESCTNGTVNDTSWQGIVFSKALLREPVGLSPHPNVSAAGTDCDLLPSITISNPPGESGGAYYGHLYEDDPYNKIGWLNTTATTCTWNGSQSTSWRDPANWDNCNNGRGSYPDSLDWVIIPSAPGNQPTISDFEGIRGFALAAGGGSITISDGAYLFLLAGGSNIRSSVTLKGAIAPCYECRFEAADVVTISDNATLTLGSGLSFVLRVGNELNVGNGVSGGHLKTGAAGAENEWPKTYYGNDYFQVNVQGAAGQPSSVEIDGLYQARWWGGSEPGDSSVNFKFVDWYQILNFDNIWFDRYEYVTQIGAEIGSYIELSDCTNATITDVNWDSLYFEDFVARSADGPGYVVNAAGTNCNLIPSITISNMAGTTGGSGYGPAFENDPYNKIDWANSTSRICTWTGTDDNTWANSSNWANCTNDRLNYPDQLDWVIIPSAPANQPTVSSTRSIRGFAAGTGGGIIELLTSRTLYLTSLESIQSDVSIKGASDTCSVCYLITLGDMTILNNATLTLLPGGNIRSSLGADSTLFIGDGTSGGFLATGPDQGSSKWPSVSNNGASRIVVNGAPGQPAGFSVDGIKIRGYPETPYDAAITLIDWYEFQKFDNVDLSYSVSNDEAVMEFVDCTNASMLDTTWTGIEFGSFLDGAQNRFNVDASHASCIGLPVIEFSSPLGSGAGDTNENDPYSRFDWN
jgi:hypothetical protein